ncbi:MAG: hypothetical protein FWG90_01965 [Oscillospiraceae bacterium]|nr:hypothetical protein [Oscillospiraceae bacterium]
MNEIKILNTEFERKLNEYISIENPHKRNKPIDVCDTPNALLAIGAKPLPIIINPNDVDKCLGSKTANKNKNSHDLTFDELSALPNLLANPVMIFKDPKNDNYVTVITDAFDKNGRPFVVGIELNTQEKNHDVNRIATMHGRDRAFESFIAKNGNKVQGYISRNILEGNLLAVNIKKAPNYYQSTGLQLPEKYSVFVSFDNSITHSMSSVKPLSEINKNLIFDNPAIPESHVKFNPLLKGKVDNLIEEAEKMIAIAKKELEPPPLSQNKKSGER